MVQIGCWLYENWENRGLRDRFNSKIPRAQFFYIISYFGFIFTSAYSSILFCCLPRNVEPCYHAHDLRSCIVRDGAWSVSHCRLPIWNWITNDWKTIENTAYQRNNRNNLNPNSCIIFYMWQCKYWRNQLEYNRYIMPRYYHCLCVCFVPDFDNNSNNNDLHYQSSRNRRLDVSSWGSCKLTSAEPVSLCLLLLSILRKNIQHGADYQSDVELEMAWGQY